MAKLDLYVSHLSDRRAEELETGLLYLFYIDDYIDCILNEELEDISMMYFEGGNLIDVVDLLDANLIGSKNFVAVSDAQDYIHDWFIRYEFNTPVDSIEL